MENARKLKEAFSWNKGFKEYFAVKATPNPYLINILREYDGKKFKSVNQGDLDLLEKEEAEKIEKMNEEKKPILESLKEALKDKVKDVVISKRLTDSAVCLVSSDGLSFEMEKVLSNMPNNEDIKAEKILEINGNHELFKSLENVYLNHKPFQQYACYYFPLAY